MGTKTLPPPPPASAAAAQAPGVWQVPELPLGSSARLGPATRGTAAGQAARRGGVCTWLVASCGPRKSATMSGERIGKRSVGWKPSKEWHTLCPAFQLGRSASELAAEGTSDSEAASMQRTTPARSEGGAPPKCTHSALGRVSERSGRADLPPYLPAVVPVGEPWSFIRLPTAHACARGDGRASNVVSEWLSMFFLVVCLSLLHVTVFSCPLSINLGDISPELAGCQHAAAGTDADV
eukprot:scaffold38364_cov40-Phaeocystis_antarctica.AAC.1